MQGRVARFGCIEYSFICITVNRAHCLIQGICVLGEGKAEQGESGLGVGIMEAQTCCTRKDGCCECSIGTRGAEHGYEGKAVSLRPMEIRCGGEQGQQGRAGAGHNTVFCRRPRNRREISVILPCLSPRTHKAWIER